MARATANGNDSIFTISTLGQILGASKNSAILHVSYVQGLGVTARV